MARDLLDLVVPADCAACRGPAGRMAAGVCAGCLTELAANRIGEARPAPMPPDFPPTLAAGPYSGVLRELLVAYKERGRHRLAGVLGERLAAVVYGGLIALDRPMDSPVALVPVPDAPAAARARYGDHLRRLAEPAAEVLTQAGYPTVVRPILAARARSDSAELDAQARAAAAIDKFTVRVGAKPGPRDCVVLVDDILTTGSTLSVITRRLERAGWPVHLAAVLAATQRTYR